MAKPFIKTSDKGTAEKLLALGFELLSQSSGIYTLVNDPVKTIRIEFADDIKKLSYSDKLEF